MVVDETRVDAAGGEVGVGEDGLEQVDVGGDSLDAEVGEGAGGAAEGVGEVRGGRIAHDLGEEGIEAGAGAVPGVAEGIRADARAGGDIEGGQRAPGGAGGAIGGHGLHVDAGLDGEAAGGGRILLGEAKAGERLAGCEAELELHKVDAGDFLGDGVLDLEASVRLDEPELARLAVLVGRDDELEGAEVAVAAGPGKAHGGGGDAVPQVGVEAGAGAISMIFWWRRWTLQSRSPKWVTAPPASPAICTSTWRARGDPPLDVEAGVAEGLPGLGGAALEGGIDLGGLGDGAHAAPAASGDSLDEHAGALGQVGEEGARLLDGDGVERPGTTGTSLASARARAWVFAPKRSRVPGVGPTKVRPASSQARARAGLSARKP